MEALEQVGAGGVGENPGVAPDWKQKEFGVAKISRPRVFARVVGVGTENGLDLGLGPLATGGVSQDAFDRAARQVGNARGFFPGNGKIDAANAFPTPG